jgi:predicted ribosomally synthesized peptide with nif11-like leader
MASLFRTGIQTEIAMSWSELERFVEDAETDGAMRRALRHCRSRRELLLAARRLGYAITRADLHQAWMLEQPAESQQHRAAQPSPDRSVEARADRIYAPVSLREAG